MLETAPAFGADAVGAGQPRFSLRVHNHSFRDKTALGIGIEYAHRVLCRQHHLPLRQSWPGST
ncbi:MAG: family peptidase [Pseudomonadota bacterium]|nr:family peptidase [Pseudomonadota bacterium]